MSKNNTPSQPGANWAFMRIFKVEGFETKIYLLRLRIIQTPWFGIYLHRIGEPDYQDPHNHPWNFFYSVILKGWYKEELQDKEYIRKKFSLHKITKDQYHKITDLKRPTYTLLIVGKRVQQWGFMTKNGWVPWHEYIDHISTRKRVYNNE